MLKKILLPLAGLASTAIGILIFAGVLTLREGYAYPRAGIPFIAAGLVICGYWAFANQNQDYNF